MKEKILFIINPISGGKSKTAIPGLIKKTINKEIYDLSIAFTDCAGQATELTQQALEDGIRTIVAVGGDGTVNEVAKALINTNATLGILPAGSGNGLSRHLNIPTDISKAIEVLNRKKERIIDSGSVNGAPFFCTSGIGFDAHIGKMFAEKMKRGFSTYIKTTLNEYFTYKPSSYELKTKEGIINNKAFLITFANASQYGNNAYIAPGADIEDGMLDVCIMSPFPKFKVMDLGVRLFAKSINGSKYLNTIKTEEVTVTREKEGPIHLDGEPYEMGKELKIKINPSSLRVIAN